MKFVRHTHSQTPAVLQTAAPGLNILRKCFGCNGNKSSVGGKSSRRSRMWYCAACVAADAAKSKKINGMRFDLFIFDEAKGL